MGPSFVSIGGREYVVAGGSMRLLRPLLVVLFTVAAVAVPGTATAAAPTQTQPALALPVSWAEFRGTFDGHLVINEFRATPDGLVAVGRLVGMTNSRYGPEQVDQPAVVPVLALAVRRHTLHLELGPLDPLPPSHVGLHLDRFAADVSPRRLTPGVCRQLRALNRAIRQDAPAEEMAIRLNRLLPHLQSPGTAPAEG
jgi:hypothetical protein